MSIFERYDNEYRSLLSQITTKISELNTYDDGGGGQSLQICKGLLRQADDLIKQMDMEARDSGKFG